MVMIPAGERTIVVVDDERSMRDYLSEVLSEQGYSCACFAEGVAALAFMAERAQPVDLVLSDISMPGMGGMDLLRTATAIFPDTPVVMISGLCDLALAVEALKGGATDYLIKPAAPSDVLAIVSKHLASTSGPSHAEVRSALAHFLAARTQGDPASPQLKELFQVLDFKRYETLQHSKRVSEYAKLLGQACQLPPKDLARLQLGALLHDIGKVAIPRNILFKPTVLTNEEMAIMQLHPSVGWELLSEFPDLNKEAELVYSHHERFDGCGYPRGLKGHDIPLLARIFGIVDTFDAITSDRPYRQALPVSRAREIIAQGSTSQFDGRLVGVFMRLSEATLVLVKKILHDGQEHDLETPEILAESRGST